MTGAKKSKKKVLYIESDGNPFEIAEDYYQKANPEKPGTLPYTMGFLMANMTDDEELRNMFTAALLDHFFAGVYAAKEERVKKYLYTTREKSEEMRKEQKDKLIDQFHTENKKPESYMG